jgi:ferredoxin
MKLMLHVAPGIVRYPLIASVILETSTLLNIERASIDAVSGEIVIEVEPEKCMEVKEAFERRGVKVVPLEIPVIRDENECVHCGACVSICLFHCILMRALKSFFMA